MSITTKRGIRELLVLIAIVVSFHLYRANQTPLVVGRFAPAESFPRQILAIRGQDSIKVLSTDGQFDLSLSPGAWKLVIPINAHAPAYIERTISLSRGQRLDLGQIRLLR